MSTSGTEQAAQGKRTLSPFLATKAVYYAAILITLICFRQIGNDNVAMRMSYDRFPLIAKSSKYSLVVKVRK